MNFKNFAGLRRVAALAVALALIPVAAVQPAMADSAPSGANVQISDTGFSARTVTIPVGGWVTWKNTGKVVHTATTSNSATIVFDTGGLGTGESATQSFPFPGSYLYTSANDCLNGNANASFDCLPFYVQVGPATAPLPDAYVQVDDKGFSPKTVTVTIGSSVIWQNAGKNVHTATTVGSGTFIDTGGFANGESGTQLFPFLGTYAYTSATDCLNGNKSASFDCSPSYVQVVPAAPTAFVNATLTDMKITLDKINVPAGNVTFTAVNKGKVLHELVILQTDVDAAHLALGPDKKADETGDLGEVNDLDPGQTGSITRNLAAGHYVLICNMPGHYVAGMRLNFTVGTPPPVQPAPAAPSAPSAPAAPVQPAAVVSAPSPAPVAQPVVSTPEAQLAPAPAPAVQAVASNPAPVVQAVPDQAAQPSASVPQTASASAPVASTVNATLSEMSIVLDQSSVPAGNVTFVATNNGVIPHELVIIQTDADESNLIVGPDAKADETGDLGEIEDLAHGQTRSITRNLAAGHYVLICNVPAHYMAGMHATLTVTG